jgi:Mg2+-importing ATPase
MASRRASPPASPPIASVDVVSAAAMSVPQALSHLATTADGLSAAEASRRLSVAGPNAVRTHRAQFVPVLLRQFRSPLLVLLAVTAVASYFVGERSDALIIGLILAASVGPRDA